MNNKVNLRICLAISMFLPAMAGLAQAATITVGSGAGYDFDTIQAGIDAAVDGDMVLVAPGEYVITEPITFLGKAITVQSEAGPDETTIRMDNPTDPKRACVVIFENNETTESILNGFTVTGGKGIFNPSVNASGGGGIVFIASSGTLKNCKIVQNRADAGGGVICSGNTLVTVNNCTITGNSATIIGAGVYAVSGSSIILTNCTITGNSVVRSGGGVACWENSSVTLVDCIISGNSATGAIFHEAGYGGGLYAGNSSTMTIKDCRIVENSAGIGGGGMLLSGNPSTLTGCMISDNSAGWWGGGVGCEFEAMQLSMTNCVIARNTAGRGGGGAACSLGAALTVSNCTICNNSVGDTWGGGGLLSWQGTVTVTNSIIWANTSPKGHEISVEEPGSTLTIAYSDVAGGQAEVHVQDVSTLDWGEGNIDADPSFADPENDDYHLKSEAGRWDPNSQTWVLDDVTSLCIDAGDPNSDWTAELWPHGERINMGAYGGTSQASRSLSDAGNVADLNRDGIVDSADMRIMVDHWGTDEPLCDIGPMPFGDGIIDIQDLIVLAEHLFEEREE